MTIHAPKSWNNFLNKEEKFVENRVSFKPTIKAKLFFLENAIAYLLCMYKTKP